MSSPQASPAPDASTPASELLEDLLQSIGREKVTIGELVALLEGRAVGLFLLVLSLPMCVPNIPGLSTVFGVLMIAPSLQLCFGRGRIWLPRRVRAVSIDRETFRKIVSVAGPMLRRIERLLRPRWSFLTSPPFTVFFGAQALLMAIILIFPIAGGNWPPGMSVAMLALALLQRDGIVALISTMASAGSVAFIAALYYYGAKILLEVGAFLQHLL